MPESRVRWELGDPDGARCAVETGLAVAAGTSTPVEVRLRIEELRHPIRVEFDASRSLHLAEATVELARTVGVDEARALILLGSAHLVAGSPEWSAHIAAGLDRAREEGDLDSVFEASNALVAANMLDGDRQLARRTACDAADLARSVHRRHWEEQFAVTLGLLNVFGGNCRDVVDWARDFVRPHLTVAVHVAYSAFAVALADIGEGREALGVIAAGRGSNKATRPGRSCWAGPRPRPSG